MHSKSTKKNPKLAKPLAFDIILRQSFLRTIAVDLRIFPYYIYLISTAFMNMDKTKPIAPPAT